MNFFRCLVFLAASALLAACSSDGEQRPEYLDSYSVQQLEIPPELMRPSSNEELRIPEPSEKALASIQARDGVEGRVSPRFKGIELQSNGDMYWLLLQKNADEVWPLLREFLANEGINIYREEPLLGFIETEWVKEYEASRDAGFLKKMFRALSADKLDKFRLRLERVESEQQTKVYVSHRSLEIVVVDDGSSWKQAVPNKMLEKEFLYRMVLFAGMSQEKADDIFQGYKSYQARIRRIGEDQSSVYEITGNKHIVWKRIIQAMDRLGADVKKIDEVNGTLEVLVGEVATELLEEKDELSETSWLMKLLSSDDDEVRDTQGRISVFVSLEELNSSTRMQLSLANNQPIESGLAEKFREGLVGLLK